MAGKRSRLTLIFSDQLYNQTSCDHIPFNHFIVLEFPHCLI